MATILTGRASVWSCHEVAWAVAAGEPPGFTPILACMRSGTQASRHNLSLLCPSL